MKKLTIMLAACIMGFTASAQTDTTTSESSDTVRVGNILIIKKGKHGKDSKVIMGREKGNQKSSKVTTNWMIFDLGFSNHIDKTDYASAGSYLKADHGLAFSKSDFKLKAGKSINVNIWLFMQRRSIVKQNVNLKYGMGLELNNYRYKSGISYRENGVIPYSGGMQTNAAFIFRDSISFSKNKLAADYVTVPVMLNFATNNFGKKKGLSVSIGVSGGYLYSQRNKQKSDERGKEKNKGDYDLERFKFSYVGELGLGPVRLYGSYSPKSIYQSGLDIRPFNIGIRFAN